VVIILFNLFSTALSCDWHLPCVAYKDVPSAMLLSSLEMCAVFSHFYKQCQCYELNTLTESIHSVPNMFVMWQCQTVTFFQTDTVLARPQYSTQLKPNSAITNITEAVPSTSLVCTTFLPNIHRNVIFLPLLHPTGGFSYSSDMRSQSVGLYKSRISFVMQCHKFLACFILRRSKYFSECFVL
jgi:hypothetical protein